MRNTTLCYLERDGAYLMLHRVKKARDVNHGKWIGVGGKFERQESPEECLIREVCEETGLTLTRWRCRGIVTFLYNDDDAEYMHLYTADRWEGTLRDCDEGDLRWVPIDQVPALNLWRGDRIFLDLLAQDVPFFSLKLTYRGDDLTAAALDGAPLEVTP